MSQGNKNKREELEEINKDEGIKKAMEQQVFQCQGMVEHGLNTNQMMITEFTNNHKMDAKIIGETIFKLQEKIEHLQAQIYDLQNQNCEYEY